MNLSLETILHQDVRPLLVGGAVFALLYVVRFVLTKFLARLAKNSQTPWDDIAVDAMQKISLYYLLALAVSVGWREHSPTPNWFDNLLTVLTFLQVARMIGHLVHAFFTIKERQLENQNQKNIFSLMSLFARFAIYVALVLSCLDTMGVNITTLVAGLGIGGIAIALAVQSVLSDLLASLSIILDRPFEVGDTIEVDTFVATIVKVGIKTTRARSVNGEEVVFPNSALLQGKIRNYKRMEERRVLFTLGFTYETPVEKMKLVPQWIRQAIEAQQTARFDRAHFASFGAYSLDYEVVYWIKSPEFSVYRDAHQAVLFTLAEKLKAEGVEFAFPTQTLMFTAPGAASGAAAQPLPTAAGLRT